MPTKLLIIIVAIILLYGSYLLLRRNFRQTNKQKISDQNQQQNKLAKQISDKLSMIAALSNNQDLIAKIEPIRNNLYNKSIFSNDELEQLINEEALETAENPVIHSLKNELLGQLELLKQGKN